jgi:hypothetical protein
VTMVLGTAVVGFIEGSNRVGGTVAPTLGPWAVWCLGLGANDELICLMMDPSHGPTAEVAVWVWPRRPTESLLSSSAE